MIKPRQTSVVILITLAELAWLAAFGLLFAYRSKVGELGNMRRELITTTSELVMWRTNAPDAAKLLDELKVANAEKTNLQARLDTFDDQLGGKSPDQVGQLLKDAQQAAERFRATEANVKELTAELTEKSGSIENLQFELRRATNSLAELESKWDALPPNATNLADLLRETSNNLASVSKQLETAGVQIVGLSNRIGQLALGEVAIRRELTGLPTNDLRRVIFIVDTSSSMHGSPAWDEARNLMRTWVEYLSVEECVLVNFNDDAVGFPAKGYHRVRGVDGTVLPEKRQELLTVFDQARPGVYSDLLKGLKLAYSYPQPDVIVMFTDGHPHVPTRVDSTYASEILKEVAKQPRVPILTVAVGSYEVEGAGGPRERSNPAIAFLKRLAGTSGGSFIGR